MFAANRLRSFLFYTLAFIAPSVLFVLLIAPRVGIQWDLPIAFSSDVAYHLVYGRLGIDGEPWWNNSRLGAPFTHNLFLYPVNDNLDYLALCFLGHALGDPVSALNVTWLLQLMFSSLTCAWVFRRMDIAPGLALPFGILFSLSASPLLRTVAHLHLPLYLVPIAVLTCVSCLQGKFHSLPTSARFICYLSSVLLGFSCQYYGYFFALLICFALLVRALAWRHAGAPAVHLLLLVVFGIINNTPSIVALSENPEARAAIAAQRTPQSLNASGLRIREFFIPPSTDPLPLLKTFSEYSNQCYPPNGVENPAQRNGLVTAFGMFLLLLSAPLPPVRTAKNWILHYLLSLKPISGLCIVLVIFTTVDGLATLGAVGGLTAIRAQARSSFFIHFMCLFAVARFLQSVHRQFRLSRSPWTQMIGWTAVLLISCLAFAEQSSQFQNMQREAYVRPCRALAEKLEAKLPRGAMVMHDYGGVETLAGYKPIFYAFSSTLRWSHTPYVIASDQVSNWYEWIKTIQDDRWASAVMSAGFDGVLCHSAESLKLDPCSKVPMARILRLDDDSVNGGGLVDLTDSRQELLRRLGQEGYANRQREVLNFPDIPKYTWGDAIDFSVWGQSWYFEKSGWLHENAFAVTFAGLKTSEHMNSVLSIPLPSSTLPIELRIDVCGVSVPALEGEHQVRLSINGREIADWKDSFTSAQTLRAVIPPELIDSVVPNEFRFSVPTCIAPVDANINPDVRRMGIRITQMTLQVVESGVQSESKPVAAPAQKPGSVVLPGVQTPAPIDDKAKPLFVPVDGAFEALEGFSRPEGDFVWMAKNARFRLTHAGQEFSFELAPFAKLIESLGSLDVEVRNDATGEVIKHQFVDSNPHTFTITSPAQGQTVTVTASKDYCPLEHGGGDTRRLSAKLLLNTVKQE